MAVSGEREFDWSGSTQNPFDDPEWDWVNDPGAIINNAFRDNDSSTGPAKIFFTATPVDRTKTITVKATLAEGGIIYGGDAIGIGFLNALGQGYVLHVSGTYFWLMKVDAGNNFGATIDAQTVVGADIPAGSEIEMDLTPDNKITTRLNGNVKTNAKSVTDYVDEVMPAAICEWLNNNLRGLTDFAIDGLQAAGVAPSWNGMPNPPPAVEGEDYLYDFGHLLDGDGPFTINNIGDFGPNGWAIVGTTFGGVATESGSFPNINLRATNSFGTDDSGTFVITVDPAPITGPVIHSVNNNNVVTSKEGNLIFGENLDTVAKVSFGLIELNVVDALPEQLTVAAVDIHATQESPLAPVTMVVENADGVTAQQDVAVEVEIGNIWVAAISLSPLGLLHSVPAEIGDGYEGPVDIAGSAVTYRAAGPHREMLPAVPNGQTSTGWFYDHSARTWEIIEETTWQIKAPVAAILVDPKIAYIGSTAATVTVTTDVGQGVMYCCARLIAGEPTPEEIVAGTGAIAVATAAVVKAGEQPPMVLQGLNPGTDKVYYWFTQDVNA